MSGIPPFSFPPYLNDPNAIWSYEGNYPPPPPIPYNILEAFFEACCRGNLPTVSQLCQYANRQMMTLLTSRHFLLGTPLEIASEEGHLNIVQHICELPGIDLMALLLPNSSDRRSAMHLACRKGHLEIVHYLCTRPGIDLRALLTTVDTEYNCTPSMIARKCGKLDVAIYLARYLH